MIEVIFIFGGAILVIFLIGLIPGGDKVLFYLPRPKKDNNEM